MPDASAFRPDAASPESEDDESTPSPDVVATAEPPAPESEPVEPVPTTPAPAAKPSRAVIHAALDTLLDSYGL